MSPCLLASNQLEEEPRSTRHLEMTSVLGHPMSAYWRVIEGRGGKHTEKCPWWTWNELTRCRP